LVLRYCLPVVLDHVVFQFHLGSFQKLDVVGVVLQQYQMLCAAAAAAAAAIVLNNFGLLPNSDRQEKILGPLKWFDFCFVGFRFRVDPLEY